jgi:hypothetical protein
MLSWPDQFRSESAELRKDVIAYIASNMDIIVHPEECMLTYRQLISAEGSTAEAYLEEGLFVTGPVYNTVVFSVALFKVMMCSPI